MDQCKQCGATLPENSRYCLQCGAERGTPETPAAPQRELDFLKPALAGGFALGVLSALPFINLVNAVCCFWVLSGGALTVWLLDRQRPGTLKYGDGALGGLLAGLVGAFVSGIIGIPIRMITMTPEVVAQLQPIVEQMPPAFRDTARLFISPGFNLTRELFLLVGNMVVDGLFAMIGGILMVAIVNRKKLD